MFIEGETIDDLMNDILGRLLKRPFDIETSRGSSSEIFGVFLQLNNPRARLSRTETKGKPFSALGELIWYLAKSNELEFISYYLPKYEENSDDGTTIHGAYGPRILNMHEQYNQFENVINLLKAKSTTRRAVIQLFDAKDISKYYKEIPCTCTLQFVIREGKLDMLTSMRSNDAFIGFPHDIFTFTMLQEIISCFLKVNIGTYYHSVGSLHLYKNNTESAKQYLNEGFQSTKESMPQMPFDKIKDSLKILIASEANIRKNLYDSSVIPQVDNYWMDLINLLNIHRFFKNDDIDSIENMQKLISNKFYNSYIDFKLEKIKSRK